MWGKGVRSLCHVSATARSSCWREKIIFRNTQAITMPLAKAIPIRPTCFRKMMLPAIARMARPNN